MFKLVVIYIQDVYKTFQHLSYLQSLSGALGTFIHISPNELSTIQGIHCHFFEWNVHIYNP